MDWWEYNKMLCHTTKVRQILNPKHFLIKSNKFLKMFGYSSLDDLPELPRYKLDENQQIVIDDIIEAPEPAREENIEEKLYNKIIM